MKISDLIDKPKDTDFGGLYGNVLYHGSNTLEEGWHEFRMRKNPRGTFGPYHHELNKRLTDKLGLPVRNLMFVTTNYNEAANYGKVYNIYPHGNDYRIFSSIYIDMTVNERTNTKGIADLLIDNALSFVAHQGNYGYGFINDVGHIIKKEMTKIEKSSIPLKDAILKCTERAISELENNELKRDILDKVENDIEMRIYPKIDAYVRNTTEIKDLNNHIKRSIGEEMMLYSPSGFIATLA